MEKTLDALDEHMECIRTLYPKEYNAIFDSVKRIFESVSH